MASDIAMMHNVVSLRERLRLGKKIIPPNPAKGIESTQTSIRFHNDILKKLDEVATREDYSRSEIVMFLLRWALEQYEADSEQEQPEPNGKRQR